MLFTSNINKVHADEYFFNKGTKFFNVLWLTEVLNDIQSGMVTLWFTATNVIYNGVTSAWNSVLSPYYKDYQINGYYNLTPSSSANMVLFGVQFESLSSLSDVNSYTVRCDGIEMPILAVYNSNNVLWFICDNKNLDSNCYVNISFNSAKGNNLQLSTSHILIKEYNLQQNDYSNLLSMQNYALDSTTQTAINDNLTNVNSTINIINSSVSNLISILNRIETSSLDSSDLLTLETTLNSIYTKINSLTNDTDYSSDLSSLESLLSQISTKLNNLTTEVNVNTDLSSVETSFDSLIDLTSNIHYDKSLTLVSTQPTWTSITNNTFNINSKQDLKAGFVVVNVPFTGHFSTNGVNFNFNVIKNSDNSIVRTIKLVPFQWSWVYVSCIGLLNNLPNWQDYTLQLHIDGTKIYASQSCVMNFVYYDNTSFSNLMSLYEYLTEVNYSSSLSSIQSNTSNINSNISSINSKISSIDSNLNNISDLLDNAIPIDSTDTNVINDLNDLTSDLSIVEGNFVDLFKFNLNNINLKPLNTNQSLLNSFNWISTQFENLISNNAINDLVKISLSIGTALLLMGVFF